VLELRDGEYGSALRSIATAFGYHCCRTIISDDEHIYRWSRSLLTDRAWKLRQLCHSVNRACTHWRVFISCFLEPTYLVGQPSLRDQGEHS